MGNWRTVNITGSVSEEEAPEMIEYLTSDIWRTPAACLSINFSLCGLNQWVNNDGSIDAVGNLAERDFENEDILAALQHLAEKFPSFNCTLHSGSDWESLVCSATFHVEDGIAEMCAPEVEEIRSIDDMDITSRLIKALTTSTSGLITLNSGNN